MKEEIPTTIEKRDSISQKELINDYILLAEQCGKLKKETNELAKALITEAGFDTSDFSTSEKQGNILNSSKSFEEKNKELSLKLNEVFLLGDKITDEIKVNGIVDIEKAKEFLKEKEKDELVKKYNLSPSEIKMNEEGLKSENRIKNSSDMRELLHTLNDIGDITASDGYVYKKDDIISLIGNLKDSNDENLGRVTRTYGLRDKVKYILLRQELDNQFNK